MKTLLDTPQIKIEIDIDLQFNPVLIINGIRFTFEFLNNLTKTFPLDQWFSLLQRKDGYITFHTHREEQEQFEKMKEFIKDLAENGTRFDLNPTLHICEHNEVLSDYVGYIKSIDKSVREKAKDMI